MFYSLGYGLISFVLIKIVANLIMNQILKKKKHKESLVSDLYINYQTLSEDARREDTMEFMYQTRMKGKMKNSTKLPNMVESFNKSSLNSVHLNAYSESSMTE